MHLEVSLQQKDDTQIVHLLNYFAQKRLGTLVSNEEVSPVRDVRVQVQRTQAPASVTLEPGGQALQWSYHERIVKIQVPEIAIHAMVVIK